MSIEHFEIKSVIRKFDVEAGRFIINISYETAPPEPTERILGVAEAFGLGVDKLHKFIIYDNVELAIGPKDIVYITGDSGSGKSVLLRELEKDIKNDTPWSCININDIKPVEGKPIVKTVGGSLPRGP